NNPQLRSSSKPQELCAAQEIEGAKPANRSRLRGIRYRRRICGWLRAGLSGAISQFAADRRFGDLGMLVRIQYFSLLRDLKGPNSVEISEGSTVADLLKTLFEQVSGLEAWNKRLLIAAGTEWVPQDYVVRPDDVISLMPPVQGG